MSKNSAGSCKRAFFLNGDFCKPPLLVNPLVLHAGMGYEDAGYSGAFPRFYLSIVWPAWLALGMDYE